MDKHRRRKLLVLPEFQLTFLGLMAFFCAGVIGVFYVVLKTSLMRLAEINATFASYVVNLDPKLNFIFALGSLGAMVILITGGLFLSHRVAGPICKLVQHLEDNPEKEIHFRKGDFFQDLAEAYNRTLTKKDSKSPSPMK